jgi:hypothetical protein
MLFAKLDELTQILEIPDLILLDIAQREGKNGFH